MNYKNNIKKILKKVKFHKKYLKKSSKTLKIIDKKWKQNIKIYKIC